MEGKRIDRYAKDDIRQYVDGWWITAYHIERKERIKIVGPFPKKYLAENEREQLNANQPTRTN